MTLPISIGFGLARLCFQCCLPCSFGMQNQKKWISYKDILGLIDWKYLFWDKVAGICFRGISCHSGKFVVYVFLEWYFICIKRTKFTPFLNGDTLFVYVIFIYNLFPSFVPFYFLKKNQRKSELFLKSNGYYSKVTNICVMKNDRQRML